MLKYRNLAVLGALLFSGLAAAGQHKEHSLREDPNLRAVEGIVTYAAHEPAKGAVVKCEDTKTLDIRTYITGVDGKYHFMNLSVNRDYELRAEKDGRQSPTARLSQFDERKMAVVNLHLR